LELFLNLAWLLISLAIVAGLQWRLRQEQRNGVAGYCSRNARLLAAVVLAFLLLPVISMTDDLHAIPMMAESERGARTVLVSATQSHPNLPPIWAVSTGWMTLPADHFRPFARIEPSAVAPVVSCSPAPQHSLRAPPVPLA
jgi:hypothetical protein